MRSINSVTQEIARLGGDLGPSDRAKLDEYLDPRTAVGDLPRT